MPKISGSFTASVNWMTTVAQKQLPGHEISFVEIAGQQKSADPLWNNARVKYWGMTGLIDGSGMQQGYFFNEHTDGSIDKGTFEARVTSAGNQTTLEGTWRITGGTGTFNGATGGGSFKSRMVSPTDMETTWEGAYETVEVKRGAGR